MRKPIAIRFVHCSAGERQLELAEEYLARPISSNTCLILVGRAQAPVWDVSGNHHVEPKKPMPYENKASRETNPAPKTKSPARDNSFSQCLGVFMFGSEIL
jgi:hypothetical protein